MKYHRCLGLVEGSKHRSAVRDTQTRPQRLTDTARSTAAMLRMTLMGSDMVASKPRFRGHLQQEAIGIEL